jgi:predicted small lipoprotein YifL
MVNRPLLTALILSAFSITGCSGDGPVLTPEAAITTAKQAWQSIHDKHPLPQYDQKETSRFEPYTATLQDGVWTVKGTIPPEYHGTALVTTVRKDTGAVSVTAIEIK